MAFEKRALKMKEQMSVLDEELKEREVLIKEAVRNQTEMENKIQMQKLIDGPVYLELFVKVVPHWRQKPGRLAELGYRGE